MSSKSIITTENVKHVAKLSRLKLKVGEIDKFRAQLKNIFDYVDQIGKMKTKKVAETSQVTGITNRFRQDKINTKTQLTQKQSISQAKNTHQGYILVPHVFGDSDDIT